MATINIANLTFTHKGNYDGSTAYVKNDVVYYSTNGNAYIAKQGTTGNAPTNGTYWSQFAAGSGGIWNAGLSIGSANQVVKVNSGGNALEFGTVSSEYVKLHEADDVAQASEINLNGYFNDNYKVYKIYMCTTSSSGGDGLYFRARTGTNGATENTDSNYEYFYNYNNKADNGNTQTGFSGSVNQDKWRLAWNGDGTTTNHQVVDLTLYEPNGTSQRPHWTAIATHYDNAYKGFASGGGMKEDEIQMTGIKFFHGSGNIGMKWVKIYGIK